MTKNDPISVPAWLADPEAISPCPCGFGPTGHMVIIQGEETGLMYSLHPTCFQRMIEESK